VKLEVIVFDQQLLQQSAITKRHEPDLATRRALQLFERALKTGLMRKLSALLGRSRLRNLTETQYDNSHDVGLQTIPIERIQGSVSRTNDFDRDFHPTQEHTKYRWVNIAAAMQNGETLPPVELIQVDDTYYVVDGHHRVSVAHAMKQAYIDAIVTVREGN
jgi:hypothetical protein